MSTTDATGTIRRCRLHGGAAAVVLGLSLLVGCDETIVEPVAVDSLRLTPTTATLQVGQSIRFTADPLDATGEPIGGYAASWSSSSPGVVAIDDQGLATAVSGGQVTIRAVVEGISGSAELQVLQPPRIELAEDSVVFVGAVGATDPTPVSIPITNGGEAPLQGLELATEYAGATQDWLEATLSATAAPAELTLSPRLAGLPAGSHEATVRLTAPDAANAPVLVSVALEVRPAAPSGLTATAGPASVVLAWVDDSEGEDGYEIQRKADGEAFTALASTAAGEVSYTDDAVQPSAVYWYRVRAFGPTTSPWSDSASVLTRPGTPTGVGATPDAATVVTVAWTNASPSDSVVVERSTGGEWTRVGSAPGDATSYVDADAAPGAENGYRLLACNGGGCSAASAVATATTPLVAPTATAATPVSPTAIALTWTDNSDNETRFEIQRRTGASGGYTTVAAAIDAGATSYTDTGLQAGQTYSYRVLACNAVACSDPSNALSTATEMVPAAPSALVVTDAATGSVSLSWTDASSNEDEFVIERSGGGVFDRVAAVGPDTETHTDTTVSPGEAYQYRVRACRADVCSDPSNTVDAVTPLLAPTGLTAAAASDTELTIAWTDTSGNESRYEIQRLVNAAFTTLDDSLPADTESYTDAGLEPATTYAYRVRACNAASCSAWSDTASGTTDPVPPPAAPGSLAATAEGPTSVSLSWSDVATETGYTVERSTDGGATWTALGDTLAANTTSYTDGTATEATAYTYRVSACNDGGCAASTATATTPPLAPTGLAATAASATEITVTWTDASDGETGYTVERSTDGGATWTVLDGALAADTDNYLDDAATEATAYTYRVSACNDGGCASSTATATTPPLAPTGLGAAAASDAEITVTWTDASDGESGYELDWREQGTTTWTTEALPADTEGFDHNGLAPATTYEYRVRACLGSVCSIDAPVAMATTDDPPPLEPVRIVTFGDSNTDYGIAGSSVVAKSYVSTAPLALGPTDDHDPSQLAGKIEARWSALGRSRPITAVNHGIEATHTGGGGHGGIDRHPVGMPQARTEVDGVTRYEAEVLGVGYLWNGGEPVNTSFPDGPVDRVQAFVPGPDDFAYVSMGSNDVVSGITVSQTLANLEWMIDRWLGAGLHAQQFIITTLPPFNRPGGELIPDINAGIRTLAAGKGVHLVDLAAYTSDDDGLTWRDASYHVDDVHYSEQVRTWLAQQIVDHMTAWVPASVLVSTAH